MISNQESPFVKWEACWLNASYQYACVLEREINDPLNSRIHALAIPIVCLVAECLKIMVDVERVLEIAYQSLKKVKIENGNVQSGVMHLCEHIRNVTGVVAGIYLSILSPQKAKETFLVAKSAELRMHLNSEKASQLYAITYALHHFFDRHDIEYRICSGTLLGVVRHKGADGKGGIIPWDDDVDIMVHPTDKEKCKQLFNDGTFTKETGIEAKWQDFTGGWECFYKDSPTGSGKLEGIGIPFVDVFCTAFNETKENIIYEDFKQQQFSTGDYFTLGEWSQLKNYAFGPITVKGIKNPHPYLHRCYGDWELAYQTMHHEVLADIWQHPFSVRQNMAQMVHYGLPRRALIADNRPIDYDKGLFDKLVGEINAAVSKHVQ